jgi:hypothetical protein
LCLWLAGQAAAGSLPDVVGARDAEPTDRYPPSVLGDALEFAALALVLENGETRRSTRPLTSVF